jgi:DNA topoisomerase-1
MLRSWLWEVEDEFARLRLEKERGTRKATFKRGKPPEKLVKAIDRLKDKIRTFKLQIVDREVGQGGRAGHE